MSIIMGIENDILLISLLAFLVIVLSIMLINRVNREKRANMSVDDYKRTLAEISELLKTNATDGQIQSVASSVSNLLQDRFKCERFIFLRKQRGYFELNYYHGIKRFSRSDFRIPFSKKLVNQMRESFKPREIDSLTGQLPDQFIKNLKSHNLSSCIPIYWRENLYGIYFYSPIKNLEQEIFDLSLSLLAQALSAAYHVKWHESKLEKTTQSKNSGSDSALSDINFSPKRLLKFLQHKKPQQIVKEIFDSIQKEMTLKHILLVYQPEDNQEICQSISNNHETNSNFFDSSLYNSVVESIGRKQFVSISDLAKNNQNSIKKLNSIGFTHLTQISLSGEKKGLMFWSSKNDPEEEVKKIHSYGDMAAALVTNAESFERARELSFTDSLTNLSNQRYFRKRLKEEMDRASRYNRFLGLIIFDLDELKQINDKFGHQAGDAVIKKMGHILRSSIRTIDIIARYGGDEFCIIMPEADDNTCHKFMDRLQKKIAGTKIMLPTINKEISCTISLGASIYPQHAKTPEQLIYTADMALLQAKENGRNHYQLFSDSVKS